MGNWQIILVFLVALLGASSCNKMEMRGFVTSYENANVRFEQSLIWNNEQGYSTIELSKNAYEINVMGDSHVGGVENLDAFFEASQNDNVAAVAIDNDVVHPAFRGEYFYTVICLGAFGRFYLKHFAVGKIACASRCIRGGELLCIYGVAANTKKEEAKRFF